MEKRKVKNPEIVIRQGLNDDGIPGTFVSAVGTGDDLVGLLYSLATTDKGKFLHLVALAYVAACFDANKDPVNFTVGAIKFIADTPNGKED